MKRTCKSIRWATLVVGIAIPLLLIPYMHNRLPPDSVVKIDEVHFSRTRPNNNWIGQVLPDDWYVNHPNTRAGWYRMSLDLSKVPAQRWAIYLPTINMNAAVYLNGELIGDGGKFAYPVTRNWNRPLFFALNKNLIRFGTNTIDVHIKADPPGSGYLSKLYLGPELDLKPLYEQRFFLKVGVVWAITIGLGFLGLFIGTLWSLRRHESIYGWFALVVLVWAAHNLNLLVVNCPTSTWFWDWTTRYSCLQWFAVLSLIFINRYIKEPQLRLEKRLSVIGVATMIVFAVMPLPAFYSLARHLWAPCMLFVGFYAMYRLWYAHRKQPTPEIRGLLMSAFVVVVFGLRDALMVNHLWDREHGLYLQYGAPVALVVFAWILVRHFVTALNVSETLNIKLERRVEEKCIEIERNYQHLNRLERERVLAEERERIMRDMHDGVGGHLVSTLALIDRDQANLEDISESLQAALADLRLMIDSLDTATSDLTTLLGMLRERLQRRLNANGIRVHWQVEPLPAIPEFGPQKALQVMRIVQEAITNVMKHARAQNLTLGAAQEETENAVVIEISDDGGGIAERPTRGRGLRNMCYRAQAIGADLKVLSHDEGTLVRIRLPVAST